MLQHQCKKSMTKRELVQAHRIEQKRKEKRLNKRKKPKRTKNLKSNVANKKTKVEKIFWSEILSPIHLGIL